MPLQARSNPNGAAGEIDISAVVPVYMGERTLGKLVDRLIAAFEGAGRTFEIILVDDDSRDNSWQIIQDIARREPRVLGVKHTRNFGQHNATLCGFRFARGNLIATLDEDLQNPPEEIEKMIAAMQATHADVVYGVPATRKHSWWRRFCSRVVMFVPRRVMKIDFDIGSFRLIRSAIAREVAKANRHDIIIDIYFAWMTSRIVSCEVRHDEDQRDQSSYRIRKLLSVFLSMMCNYTTLPLRIASVMGALLSLGSIGLAIYFVVIRLTHEIPVHGFTAIIVSVLFSAGLILLGIGVLSEYLARTFMRINQRPQSIVRTTTGLTAPHTADSSDIAIDRELNATVAATTRELSDVAR